MLHGLVPLCEYAGSDGEYAERVGRRVLKELGESAGDWVYLEGGESTSASRTSVLVVAVLVVLLIWAVHRVCSDSTSTYSNTH